MKNLCELLRKSKYKYELIAAGALGLVTMLLLCYYDGVLLAVWSTNLWDCVAAGNLDYYGYCAQNLHDLPMLVPGGILLPKLPGAIWCLPIWVAQYFFGVEISSSVLCMTWARLFYAVLLWLTVWQVRKICRKLQYSEEQVSLVSVLCMVSVFAQISISYAGQTDLEWILLGTMAVYYYLEDDWKKFYLLVNLSMVIKPYFFPVAFLLILYSEKDVLKIIGRTCMSALGYLVIMVIFRFYPGYQQAKVLNKTGGSMLAEYINPAILFPYGWASILIIVVALIMAGVYLMNIKDRKKDPRMVIYLTAAFYVAWYLVAGENFYRLVMLIPWLYMALFTDENKNELMMWLTTMYTYVFILVYRFHETVHYFSIKTGMYVSVIPRTLIDQTEDFFTRISQSMGSTFAHIGYMINGGWVALSLVLLVVMHPLFQEKVLRPAEVPNRPWVIRTLLALNVVAIVPLVLSALISFVF